MAEPVRTAPRPGVVGAGMLALVATLVAMWPYTGVIAPGAWTFVVVMIIAATAASGVAGRRLFRGLREGIRSLLTLLLQLVVLLLALTILLASEAAQFGLVPTAATFELTGLRLQRAVDEISNGVAPIDSTVSMTTAMGVAFALVALLVDHLLAQRLVVLTVLFTSIVGAVPMLLTFGSVNLVWFVLQAIMILIVLRFGARHDRDAIRHSSFVAAGLIGAAAIAATVFVSPGLPLSVAAGGHGQMPTVNADLRLGDDLRRPNETEALTVVTSAAAPPYLRLATLSRFDGEVWRPDRSDRNPVEDGFGARQWTDDIETVEHEVSIRVVGMSSSRLPVPYAAEEISGLPRGWQAMPLNRTVISSTQDAAGADYTVQTATPAPSLEQIRASSAGRAELVAAPAGDLPEIIGELAREVTSGTDTDYDRLLALQDWFRSEFEYSLDAPVEDGFDGTGADAVATFLDVRSGYCIHFAGAFALMAQALDMPVRIVVGYLPGTATEEKRGDQRVYSVTSDRLHSWPEVYFRGIGWVPFEPTATLGTPTGFVSDAGSGGDGDADVPTASGAPTAAPSTAPTGGPDRRDEDPGAGGDSALRQFDPTPVALGIAGVLVVLLLPGLARALRRMLRTRRAAGGDAIAAWREVADTMADLRLSLHESDTARTRAQSLVAARGANAEAIGELVNAVERRSYAEGGPAGGELDAALRRVLGDLELSVSGRRRLLAWLLPASLLRR
ncbi:transglutaminaseTgpA domain-containing protein [Microbacterium sp. NPDC089987]|uniref:transglutaminaseTgpA domain-containing protein n=1 Tax=Microbacterium sp. NPDC089987 TaxID=3364202 RepID=UPI003804B8EA